MKHTTYFAGGSHGNWHVKSMITHRGKPLPMVSHLNVGTENGLYLSDTSWIIEGATSHLHYTTQKESVALKAVSHEHKDMILPHVVAIFIRKSDDWWQLAQDERRKIFEEISKHTTLGLAALPEIWRTLYHARDLSQEFDFITWFEFTTSAAERFNHVLNQLRQSEEWHYVDREIELILHKNNP